MRAGNFSKQEKCNRTDSVEGKNNEAGGTNHHRNGALWNTGVHEGILGVFRRI